VCTSTPSVWAVDDLSVSSLVMCHSVKPLGLTQHLVKMQRLHPAALRLLHQHLFNNRSGALGVPCWAAWLLV
jgi:hypothetical protein